MAALALHSPVQAACPTEEFAGQFQGAVPVALGQDEAVLVLLDQFGEDLKLFIDGATPLWLNGAGGRNSSDYVLLEQAVDGASPSLCLYSVFAHSTPGHYATRFAPMTGNAPALLEALRLFNTAAVDWASGTTTAVARGADVYDTLAATTWKDYFDDPELAFQSRLFAAIADIRMLRYEAAQAQLDILEQRFPAHPAYAKVLFQQAKIKSRQRRPEEAIVYLEQALDLLEARDETLEPWLRPERGEVENWLGEAYINVGNLALADATFDLAVRDAAPDFSLLGRIYNNRGLVAIRRSEAAGITKEEKEQWYAQATDLHLDGADFSREARDIEILQVIENNVAIHYARIGDRRKSIAHFLQVLQLLQVVDNPERRAFLYSNLSNYSQILGEYNKAAAYLQAAIALSTNTSPTTGSVAYHCRLGTLFRLLGNLDEAEDEHRLCLQDAEAITRTEVEAEAHLELSMDAAARRQFDVADTFLQPALALRPELASNFYLVQRLQIQHAALLLAAEQPAAAEDAITEALAIQTNDVYPNEEVAALDLSMRIALARGDKATALQQGAAAIARIEALHTQLEAERIGPAWSNQTDAVYTDLAEIHLRDYLQNPNAESLMQAFEISERSRDISLRQRLAAPLGNDAIALEQREQIDRYSQLADMLTGAGSDLALPSPATLDYYHQHDLLSLARLNGLGTLPVPASLSLTQVQERLRPGQLVLDYLISADSLYVLTITRERYELKRVPLEGELAALLAADESLLRSPRIFPTEGLQTLSDSLLPALASYPEASELLIVPHGPLHAFPFAALALPDSANGYVPLIASYSVQMLPSLSLYFMNKPNAPATHSVDVAILADPVFDNPRVSSLAPELVEQSGLRGWSESLTSLPYTAREADNINRHVHGATLTYTGAQASRAMLTSAAVRNARVLHIATHGYFKSPSEDNIGLALSTVDETGQPAAGFITLTELFGYTFNNELVVISGCDTAMGQAQAGVGFNSLNRGFLAQGAKHVISTLWPVSDRASAVFMTLFYDQLQTRGNVAEALRQAQLDLSRMPDYRNPNHWAGYVLTSVTDDPTIALTP